jgi:hypothetical protein
MLCAATIKEFQKIIKEDYEREITIEQASDIANTLVRYFDLLAKIKHRNTEPLDAKNKCHEK